MTLKIAILDVGHGDCAVVYNSDRSSVMVIDCANGPVLLDYLNSEGLNHVDIALVTHNDRDHVGGMTQLLRNHSVGLLAIHPNIKDTQGFPKRVMTDLTDEVELRGTPFAHITTKDATLVHCLNSLSYQAELIYPNQLQATQASRSNTTSAVLRVEWLKKSALFGGDLDSEGWERLDQHGSLISKIQSDVFRFPHHGGTLVPSKERCTSKAFTLSVLEKVSPEITLISTAQRDGWEHPDFSVLDGLREYSKISAHRFLCTQVTSACDPVFCSKRNTVLSMLPDSHKSACSKLGCPCSGNIKMQFDANGNIIIESENIYQQITQIYANPQCH